MNDDLLRAAKWLQAKGEQRADDNRRKVIRVLESSDIVWSKYGSQTIEQLADELIAVFRNLE